MSRSVPAAVRLRPEDRDAIGLEPPVAGNDREALQLGLGDQHPIKRIGVMPWEPAASPPLITPSLPQPLGPNRRSRPGSWCRGKDRWPPPWRRSGDRQDESCSSARPP